MPKAKEWLCALCAHWKWGAGAVVALAVVAAFNWRVDIACWIGYAMTADGLKPGARFFRDFIIALAAAVGIGVALWRTAAFDRQTNVAEKRLLDERFATAAELMAKESQDGKPAIPARISGIYIMEKLAISAPEGFVVQVIKNLIAYIKGHAQLTAILPTERGKVVSGGEHFRRMLGEDVKAAFAVLHNILSIKTIKDGIDNAILDFSHQDFGGLNFGLGSLRVNLGHYKIWVGVNFKASYLAQADFDKASLMGAELAGACLRRAVLTEANLYDADMTNADLQDADLRGAKYDGKDLAGAHLAGAKMGDNRKRVLRD